MTSRDVFDLLIVGGAINGVGIARHTSSSTTKLVHGGLRYLEHFQFRLVREGWATSAEDIDSRHTKTGLQATGREPPARASLP